MSEEGYARMIDHLLAPARMSETEHLLTQPSPTPPSTDEPAKVPGSSGAAQYSGAKETSSEEPKTGERPAPGSPADFVINEDALVIKAAETKFAERLFPLIPSPRAAKRFSNVYRILKAPVRRERLSQFEGTLEMPGDFQVPMLLLASICAPTEAAMMFPALLQSANSGADVTEGLDQFALSGLSSDPFSALDDKIRPIISDKLFPRAPNLFAEWLPRVSRFSFEVGRAMQPFEAAKTVAGFKHTRAVVRQTV